MTDELKTGWTQPLVEAARKILNAVWGIVPACSSNDAKYKVDLGDLVYSEKELLRIAFETRGDWNERAERVTNYLAQCNPHLKKSFNRMNVVTKRLFYNELSDDKQFSWCLNKYPGIELAAEDMRPGVRGLHITDSVGRDNFRKKYLTSPLGAILLFLLHTKGKKKPGEPSQKDLMDSQPPLDPSRPPIMGPALIGGLGGATNFAFNQFLYGTYSSFDTYALQKSEEQAKVTADLLRERVSDVVQQHKNVRLSSHDKRLVKCVSVDPDDSPTIDASSEMYSESLKKLKLGETGCTSVCGTQPKSAVDKCLSQTRTPSYSSEDNQYCESLGQFKSEDALTSDYMDEARQGIFRHEKNWREDQRAENGGECKEPRGRNFNPYPGIEIDERFKYDASGDLLGRFMSDGVDYKKGCRLPSIHTEFQHEPPESLICKDNQPGQPYTPNIQAIESVELARALKELSERLATDENQDCPFEE